MPVGIIRKSSLKKGTKKKAKSNRSGFFQSIVKAARRGRAKTRK